MLRGGWFSRLLESEGWCRCVLAKLALSEKKEIVFSCLLVAFAAACSGKIVDLKPQYSIRISEIIQSSQVKEIIYLHDTSHIMLLLYLLLSKNRHSYSLLKILPLFFITSYNPLFKSPFYTATKDTSHLVQGRQVHYQCHTQQYHLNRAMDRTRPNLGPARARSTNIR